MLVESTQTVTVPPAFTAIFTCADSRYSNTKRPCKHLTMRRLMWTSTLAECTAIVMTPAILLSEFCFAPALN